MAQGSEGMVGEQSLVLQMQREESEPRLCREKLVLLGR